MLDVTVVAKVFALFVRLREAAPGAAAAAAAERKYAKYLEQCRHALAHLVPFAVEVFGRLNREASRFLHALAAQATQGMAGCPAQAASARLRAWRTDLAFASDTYDLLQEVVIEGLVVLVPLLIS